jgi:hypothetical protein
LPWFTAWVLAALITSTLREVSLDASTVLSWGSFSSSSGWIRGGSCLGQPAQS